MYYRRQSWTKLAALFIDAPVIQNLPSDRPAALSLPLTYESAPQAGYSARHPSRFNTSVKLSVTNKAAPDVE